MEETENAYYRVQYSRIVEDANHDWRGRAKIFRQDNHELVDQITVRHGQSLDDVKNQLLVQTQKRISNLPQPPEHWRQDSIIPILIQDYLSMRDQIYGLFLKSNETKGNDLEARCLKKLKQEIAALSEPQKVELVTPTRQQRANRADPRVLDMLTAKKVLYGLIDTPSQDVRAGYADLAALLNLEELV